MGNRISQVVTSHGTKYYTWYIRDAQGNILSTYTAQGNTSLDSLKLQLADRFMYGSSRLGTIAVNDYDIDGDPGNTEYYYEERAFAYDRGYKSYELTNHLGNVLATVSDRKFGVSSGGSSLIDHYEPHIVTAQNYYPFGMLSRVALPSGNKSYTFGFNGKMNDNEVKGGLGNQLDFGGRIYDNRIGRWLSPDPLVKPDVSSFQFGRNNPTNFIDPDGADEIHFVITNAKYVGGSPAMGLHPKMEIVVVKKEGPDSFFYHQVSKVMTKKETVVKGGGFVGDAVTTNWVQSSIKDKVTEFYPSAGLGDKGGPLSGTGVTTSSIIPFVSMDDPDKVSLAKLATPELLEYLEKKDPDKYGSLGLFKANLKLADAGQAVAGMLTILPAFKSTSVSNKPQVLFYGNSKNLIPNTFFEGKIVLENNILKVNIGWIEKINHGTKEYSTYNSLIETIETMAKRNGAKRIEIVGEPLDPGKALVPFEQAGYKTTSEVKQGYDVITRSKDLK